MFGAQGTNRRAIPIGDPELEELLDAELWEQVKEEIELLDEVRQHSISLEGGG